MKIRLKTTQLYGTGNKCDQANEKEQVSTTCT